MPFKTAAGHHNRAVIKTEVRIPRNAVIENNAVIQSDYGSQNAVGAEKNQK